MAESIKKFIIKDAHGGTKESGSFSVVGEVHVNIVPGYGEPYAESEYVNGILTITIHNIEGNGITDITTDSQEGDEAVNTVTIKTNANPEGVVLEVRNGSRGNGIASSSEVLSPEDGGTNTHTITDTDGNEHVFHTTNGHKGDKGDQGDSAVYDPSSPDAPDFVMANTTGQSTKKSMTQKAVTEALMNSPKSFALIGEGGDNAVTTVISLKPGHTYKISLDKTTWNVTIASGSSILSIGKYVNDVWTSIYNVTKGNAAKSEYIVYVDPSSLRHTVTAKADVGEQINFAVEDITAVYSALETHVVGDSFTDTNNQSNGFRFYVRLNKQMTPPCTLRFKGTMPTGVQWGFQGFDTLANMQSTSTIPKEAYGYVDDVREHTFKTSQYLKLVFKAASGNLTTAQMTAISQNVILETFPTGNGITAPLVDSDGSRIAPITTSDAVIHGGKTLKEYLESPIATTDLKPISLPAFVQGGYKGGASSSVEAGVSDEAALICCTNSVILLPYRGVDLEFVVPQGMLLLPKFLKDPTNSGAYSNYMANGDTFTVPEDYHSFIVDIGYDNGSKVIDTTQAVDPDEVNELVHNGDIAILYKPYKNDINAYINASMHPWDGIKQRTSGSTPSRLAYKYASILHVSDLHGDLTRWENALAAAEKIGADAVVNTGDNVLLSQTSGMGYIHDVGKNFDIPQMIVAGNHDTLKTDSLISSQTIYDNTEIYNAVIKNFEDVYTLPSSEYYDDKPTYYYKDFSTKIRFVALNLYEQDRTSYANSKYSGCRISKKQIDWLINTLASTPSGYGVMIGLHQAPDGVVKPSAKIETAQDVFWQRLYHEYVVGTGSVNRPTTWTLYNITDSPLIKIVDAFISKSTCNFSFSNTTVNGEETVNVSGDFTSVANGVEFIAWMCGHFHSDNIGYIEDAENLQLCLTVAASCALTSTANITALAESQDLPRGEGKGIVQDAYNVYTIDRERGEVRIAKGGSNVTCELQERFYEKLPYKAVD